MEQAKKAWEMTPEEFGKSFAPVRTATHPPGFSYPFADGKSHATREAAVHAGHRHVVASAIDAGQAIPEPVQALYPDLAKSEFAELATEARSESSTIEALAAAVKDVQAHQGEQAARAQIALTAAHHHAQETLERLIAEAAAERREADERAARTQATLAKCLAEAERERDRLVGAALLAHDDAQSLHHHASLSLAKALAAVESQGEAAFIQASEFRGELDRVYAALRQTLEAFTDIAKTQADAMRAMAEPAKPKKWTFTIRRDSHGNIEGLDATQSAS